MGEKILHKKREIKKIPAFKSDEEAARFWEIHSFEDYVPDTRPAGISFVRKPKKTVTVRLDNEDIRKVEEIARKKGLNYTALIRMWIKERLAA
jgi:predicted DNA binding CopG/RHH family protein